MGLELVLIVLVTVLGIAAAALAFLSYRLTKIKLRSEDGRVVAFEASFSERLEKLESSIKKANQLRERANASLDQASKDSSEAFRRIEGGLVRTLAENQKSINALLGEAHREIGETREILSGIRHLAEEKKTELEDYKAGFRASASKDALLHLCDVRDHLIAALDKMRGSPAADGAAIRDLEDIEWELAGTLERLDLFEIEGKPGDSCREERFQNRIKVVGTLPTDNPDDHGRIARILKRGYLTRVKRSSGEDEVLFRQLQVQAYRSDRDPEAVSEPSAGLQRDDSADNDAPPQELNPEKP